MALNNLRLQQARNATLTARPSSALYYDHLNKFGLFPDNKNLTFSYCFPGIDPPASLPTQQQGIYSLSCDPKYCRFFLLFHSRVITALIDEDAYLDDHLKRVKDTVITNVGQALHSLTVPSSLTENLDNRHLVELRSDPHGIEHLISSHEDIPDPHYKWTNSGDIDTLFEILVPELNSLTASNDPLTYQSYLSRFADNFNDPLFYMNDIIETARSYNQLMKQTFTEFYTSALLLAAMRFFHSDLIPACLNISNRPQFAKPIHSHTLSFSEPISPLEKEIKSLLPDLRTYDYRNCHIQGTDFYRIVTHLEFVLHSELPDPLKITNRCYLQCYDHHWPDGVPKSTSESIRVHACLCFQPEPFVPLKPQTLSCAEQRHGYGLLPRLIRDGYDIPKLANLIALSYDTVAIKFNSLNQLFQELYPYDYIDSQLLNSGILALLLLVCSSRPANPLD